MRKIIFKVIKWILLVLILILAVIVVWNYACKRNEVGLCQDLVQVKMRNFSPF